MVVDWSELAEFGRQADESVYPAVEVGGYLALGSEAASRTPWGEEDSEYGRSSAEAGTRRWEGARASAAPACAPAPAVDGELAAELNLEELLGYHPDARWLSGSSGTAYLEIPVGLFRTLPYRATLVIELPTEPRGWLYDRPRLEVAPALRAWGYWESGMLVESVHAYPDLSICSFMSGEWVPGRNAIEDLVGFYICWLGKVLFEQKFGRWPGRQHSQEIVRVARRWRREFCGCGGELRYLECHGAADAALSYKALVELSAEAAARYRAEIVRRGLAAGPPSLFW